MSNLKPVQVACIIDDDATYVFALEKMISIFKIAESVLSFANGEEALDYLSMAKEHPAQIPDIIFLDINMPIMNGWQFLDSFSKISNQLSKQISIYMISSSIDMRDMDKAKSYATVADYLIKPIKRADLIHVLEEVQSIQK